MMNWQSHVRGSRCKIIGNVEIRNIGNLNAPSTSVRFYQSNSGLSYTEDSFLKQVSTGRMKTSRGKVKKLSYSFPSGKSASGKYIIAVVDANNTVTEADETNNKAFCGPLP